MIKPILVALVSFLACLGLLWLLHVFAVFCPEKYVWYVAGELHCGSLRWSLFTSYGVAFGCVVVTFAFCMWVRWPRLNTALAVGPNALLLVTFLATTPSEIYRANHGAIGPDSLINDFYD